MLIKVQHYLKLATQYIIHDLLFTESEGQVEEIPPITEDHPEIQHAIKIAEEKVRASPVEPSSEMYIEALAEGIKEAEQRRRDDTQDGRR